MDQVCQHGAQIWYAVGGHYITAGLFVNSFFLHLLAASDVLYFTALGTPLLVINSFEVAHELLDKKGALYSSRPRLVMIKEL